MLKKQKLERDILAKKLFRNKSNNLKINKLKGLLSEKMYHSNNLSEEENLLMNNTNNKEKKKINKQSDNNDVLPLILPNKSRVEAGNNTNETYINEKIQLAEESENKLDSINDAMKEIIDEY